MTKSNLPTALDVEYLVGAHTMMYDHKMPQDAGQSIPKAAFAATRQSLHVRIDQMTHIELARVDVL